ncbi:hypothetical protein O5274_28285, partial [Escherichia coli]|nr:hypothetical protein [Escherichia coli]
SRESGLVFGRPGRRSCANYLPDKLAQKRGDNFISSELIILLNSYFTANVLSSLLYVDEIAGRRVSGGSRRREKIK